MEFLPPFRLWLCHDVCDLLDLVHLQRLRHLDGTVLCGLAEPTAWLGQLHPWMEHTWMHCPVTLHGSQQEEWEFSREGILWVLNLRRIRFSNWFNASKPEMVHLKICRNYILKKTDPKSGKPYDIMNLAAPDPLHIVYFSMVYLLFMVFMVRGMQNSGNDTQWQLAEHFKYFRQLLWVYPAWNVMVFQSKWWRCPRDSPPSSWPCLCFGVRELGARIQAEAVV